MDRSLRSSEGFTLLELVIALALGAVILLTASNFLVNYVKYSLNFIKSEASLMGTSLAVFEEIADKISFANKAVCRGGSEVAMDVPAVSFPGTCANNSSCVQLRCDTLAAAGVSGYVNTPLTFSDDTVYTYWLSGTDLYKQVNSGTPAIIATGINTFSVSRVNKDNAADSTYLNTIRLQLGFQASRGATGGVVKEYLDTTVIMREKSLT